MPTENQKPDNFDIDELLALTPDDEAGPDATDDAGADTLTIAEAPTAVDKKKGTPRAPRARTSVPASVETIAPSGETDIQRQIRLAKEELAQPLPSFATAELTPEEQELKELQDALAKRNAVIADQSPTQFDASTGTGEKILFHMLDDGFIFNGQVTYRGQEFEVEVGSQAYKQTLDRTGRSWLDLIDDIDAQFDRWGMARFGPGPWRGRRKATVKDIPSDLKTEAERTQWLLDMQKAEQAEVARGRRAPVFASATN